MIGPDSPPVLVGVDGGGTKTVAWVADLEGNILGRGIEERPSNQKTVGFDAAALAIFHAISKAIADARLGPVTVEIACLGLAGFDRPEDKQAIESYAHQQFQPGRLVVVNDGELVLAAGTPEGWGVAVIAGTGSIAVGRSRDGRPARAGGWGPVFGDEGSGYGTAIAALRLVAERYDGRREADGDDPLTESICRAVDIADPSGLVSRIYAPGFDRPRIAALASCVLDASERDPNLVGELLHPAGRELARTVLAVARSLDLPRQNFPLAMAGGFLLAADPVSQAMLDEMSRSGYSVVPRRVVEPVSGALILARRALRASPEH